MGNFIKVKESRYGDTIYLNVDNISVISPSAGYVLVNGTHGEETGMYSFDSENMQKILNEVKPQPNNKPTKGER